jgi:DNA-binding transcriptional regulator GbsR (MarR family)
MREIAEGCGFEVEGYQDDPEFGYEFINTMRCVDYDNIVMSGQEITLSELRELAELSKIKLPCEMEVRHREDLSPVKQFVIDFYKGQAVIKINDFGNFLTYARFRIPNNRAGEIKAKIKEHQEAIDKLNKELEGIK